MKRLFITGGTGFFGKSLLDYRRHHPAFAAEYELTILSREPERFAAEWPALAGQPGVGFVKGDVRDLVERSSTIFAHGGETTRSSTIFAHVGETTRSSTIFAHGGETGRYDAILHFATPAVTTLSDEEMTSIIIDGTRAVIDFAKANGIKKVLFASSGAVYGRQFAPVDEEAPCAPTTAYGKGKLDAEQMLIDSGLDVKIARCFAFTGQYLNRDIHYAIGNFLRDALAGGDLVVNGDGTPLRSYLYADDLVEWLFAILECGVSGRAYNVGSPEAISIAALAAKVKAVLNTPGQVDIRGVPGEGPAPVYVPIVDRIRRELGVKVSISIDQAIALSVGHSPTVFTEVS